MATKLTSPQALEVINKFIRDSLEEADQMTIAHRHAYAMGALSVLSASLLCGEPTHLLDDIIKQVTDLPSNTTSPCPLQ